MKSGRRDHVIPGARMRWMVTTKFRPVRMEENPATKIASPASTIFVLVKLVLKGAAEGSVERPTSVDAAGQHAVQHHHAADDVEIPAEQVDAGEGEILCPDHHGHEEIAECGGGGRNQEEI